MTRENGELSAPQASTEKSKPPTKAGVAPQGANVAAKRAKSAKKASSGKKSGVRATSKATKKAGEVRVGSKAARILALLKRADGVTLKELVKAAGWQPHSVRGFLSGTIGKRMGLRVTSTKTEDGERRYLVKA